jgi:hypothetical protein
MGVAIDGDYAYLANDNGGFQVVDISDPANPSHAGGCRTPGAPLDLAIVGDFAFVADNEAGLQIIDVSDPSRPKHRGFYDTPGPAGRVEIAGDLAFVADGTLGGLQIVEVFGRESDRSGRTGHSLDLNPAVMVETVALTTIETGCIRWQVSADSGVHWTPVLADGGPTPLDHPGDGLWWRSTLLAGASGVSPGCSFLQIEYGSGQGLIDDELISAGFAPARPTPNPFRARTALHFGLPERSKVHIAVHDVRGRLVTVLADRWYDAGRHSETWSGCGTGGVAVAPGVYFVRMQAGDFECTAKIVRLR